MLKNQESNENQNIKTLKSLNRYWIIKTLKLQEKLLVDELPEVRTPNLSLKQGEDNGTILKDNKARVLKQML